MLPANLAQRNRAFLETIKKLLKHYSLRMHDRLKKKQRKRNVSYENHTSQNQKISFQLINTIETMRNEPRRRSQKILKTPGTNSSFFSPFASHAFLSLPAAKGVHMFLTNFRRDEQTKMFNIRITPEMRYRGLSYSACLNVSPSSGWTEELLTMSPVHYALDPFFPHITRAIYFTWF